MCVHRGSIGTWPNMVPPGAVSVLHHVAAGGGAEQGQAAGALVLVQAADPPGPKPVPGTACEGLWVKEALAG